MIRNKAAGKTNRYAYANNKSERLNPVLPGLFHIIYRIKLTVRAASRQVRGMIFLSAENAVVQFLQSSKRFFGFELIGQQAAVGYGAVRRVDEVRISH